MPLIQSDSKSATDANFDEVRHGKTYARTRKKHGRETARRQMIAIVLSNKRKAAAKKHSKKSRRKRVAGK